MPPPEPPVRPRRKDEGEYERTLWRIVLTPMGVQVRAAVAAAQASYEAIREAIRAIPEDPVLGGLSREAARAHMVRVKAFHTARFRRAMRRYLGVRVDLLTDTPLDLEARVGWPADSGDPRTGDGD